MTISSSTRKAGPFTGNGTATTFPFTFKVFQASDLLVVRLNTSTSVESTLVLNTDYTVALNQNQNTNPGGSIVLGSVLATGFTLTATSNIQNLQPTDLTNQGGFYPTVINDALDRATIQIQQIQGEVSRSLTIPISDNGINLTLPTASNRANKALVFDENGNPRVSVDNYIDQLANVTAKANAASNSAASAAASAGSAATSAGSAAASAVAAQGYAETVLGVILDYGLVIDAVGSSSDYGSIA